MVDSVTALDSAYGDLAELIGSLDEASSWRSTRCAGWVVRDLVFHLLADAQRALVALATPATEDPDCDAVTYWRTLPSTPDPEYRETRALRSMASQASMRFLADSYVETSAAVRVLARRTPAEDTVATQGHVLRVDDLCATLAVEAGLHHLDLMLELDWPGPSSTTLQVVRATLDGLLGRPTPAGWPVAQWALVATGRTRPTELHHYVLGADVERLPLLS